MSDFPLHLMPVSQSPLVDHIDVEGKLQRALEALGGRLTEVEDPRATGRPDASADVIVGFFSAYRGVDRVELAEADRVLRPGGRLLIVHDYGRDDVSRLHDPELPEYRSWSHRDGPFLRGGFRIRVIHCWWTFASAEEAAELLGSTLGEAGRTLAASLTRPRLSHNVAVYHRDRAVVRP